MTDSSEKRQVSSKERALAEIIRHSDLLLESGDEVLCLTPQEWHQIKAALNTQEKTRVQAAHRTQCPVCQIMVPDGETHLCTNGRVTAMKERRSAHETLKRRVCEWSEIEEGTGKFNTCKPGESFHLTQGMDLYPFCHWCGLKIEVTDDGYIHGPGTFPHSDGCLCSKCKPENGIPNAQKACEAPPVDNDHVADGCGKFDV